jgi:UDP-N-acetyl-2-amino-2-deoxyglucuronate dehydrogenase
MKNFALIGAGGYIAPKHMKAIRDTGNNLIAALDKNDSVGILDTYFPEADFFTEFERFDRHIEKLKRQGTPTDYVVVCSPNYLHDSHIRFGLRAGADVICEKPVVLNPWNAEALIEIEEETGRSVYAMLQLRMHPAIVKLREKVLKIPSEKKFNVQLQYITPRGRWYHISWKGDVNKSGGIASNIGVHFFDMLLWIFGDVKNVEIKSQNSSEASGILELERANVTWQFGIDAALLPPHAKKQNSKTCKMMLVDGEEIDFSEDGENLHTHTYGEILKGNGIRLAETLPTIALLHKIRNKRI